MRVKWTAKKVLCKHRQWLKLRFDSEYNCQMWRNTINCSVVCTDCNRLVSFNWSIDSTFSIAIYFYAFLSIIIFSSCSIYHQQLGSITLTFNVFILKKKFKFYVNFDRKKWATEKQSLSVSVIYKKITPKSFTIHIVWVVVSLICFFFSFIQMYNCTNTQNSNRM